MLSILLIEFESRLLTLQVLLVLLLKHGDLPLLRSHFTLKHSDCSLDLGFLVIKFIFKLGLH